MTLASFFGNRWTRAFPDGLRAQLSAQNFQRLDDLRRPLGHFIFPQRTLRRLKPGPQEQRILARSDVAPAQNLYRKKAAQYRQAKPADTVLIFPERDSIVKDKGKISFHRWIPRQGLISNHAQSLGI